MHRFIVLVVLFMAGFFVGATIPWGMAFQAGRPPFRDAGEQREQIIRELQDIKALVKEQNALLRSLSDKDKGQ